MKKTLIVLSLLAAFGHAYGKEVQVTGEASVSATGSPLAIQSSAKAQAKLAAVSNAVNIMLGPDATKDPAVASQLQSIASQVTNDRIIKSDGAVAGNEYVMSVTLALDDKEFRKLLSDMGLASNTSTTRSFSILAIMDEFFTTPTDLKAPLEELEEFSHEKGKSFKDKSVSAKSAKQANASSASDASSVDARASSNAKVSGSYDTRVDASGKMSAQGAARDSDGAASFSGSRSASFSGRDKGQLSGERSDAASYKEAQASSRSDASAKSGASVSAKNVASEEHDNVRYKKLVKYQPQNRGPEKTSQTYNALKGQLQDYDIKVLDNDLFKSRYFKNKPITIDQMQNSQELAKYVAYAKQDAKADFFMVGTSIIIDSGKNAATGETTCTGVMSVKTYSTASGEDIASETTSETGAGLNPNDCAGNVAKKLASFGGSTISARVQDYWKRRNTYGKEYILTLKGSSLPLMTRMAFAKAIKSVPGVVKDVQRSSSDTEYQVVVTYKGSDPIDQAVAMNLASQSAFANLDSRTDGDQVTLCLASCASMASKAPSGKKK
jgi:hypothetical protein